MRARRRGWAAVLLAGATGMSGVGSVLWFTALPAAAFTAPVKIVDRAFDPQTTRIEVDDKVLWRNLTDERHTITSDSGDTEFDYTLGRKNAQEERRFESPGTYTYHCKFHPEMTGTIEVIDPDAAPTTTSTTRPAQPPPPPPPPPTTTTTAPPPTTATTAPSTTTTTPARPPAAVPAPPVPQSAAAPPPLATSSTTTMPPTTTTTVPPTTATSAPPPVTEEAAPPTAPPPTPPSTEEAPAPDTGDEVPTAAGPISPGGDGSLDPATVTLISLLVVVGLFGAWTLIRIRPGRI